MINVRDFVDELIEQGTHYFTGVPCSYLTPLINEVIAREETHYVLASNEGEALSLASGLWLANKTAVVLCQNSGLGNLINPLTSLNEPFSIPVLLLVTWRGQPGTSDEPQHRLMGEITPQLLSLAGVEWALLPDDETEALASLQHACNYIRSEQRPYALVLTGNQFCAAQPQMPAPQSVFASREEALATLLAHADPAGVIIATTGKTGRELFTLSDRPEHFYCVGSMGYASAIAHGIALGCAGLPVYVVDGDGAALMHLGNFAGIGASKPDNLIHIILDNGSYDSTGAQPTASPGVDFVAIAYAAGYAHAQHCNDADSFAKALCQTDLAGPRLLHVPIRIGSMAQLGRPTLSPYDVARRLRTHLGTIASASPLDNVMTTRPQLAVGRTSHSLPATENRLMNIHETTQPNALNAVLTDMDIYASKAISLKAKADPSIANLSFGEPVFGPPEHLLQAIEEQDLSLSAFMDGSKRYEDPRGSLALRQAIAAWYRDRYDLNFDPEREIMVTHGGVEAITLALLVTTSAHDKVAISDPSYMLYARTLKTLERTPLRIARPAGNHEYAQMLAQDGALEGVKAMIVNSPENPTGYVASPEDWVVIGERAARSGCWIIHDEVYDAMHFKRSHQPARAIESLADNSIIINSFSKKFGLPGLRIGWMIAPPQVIEQAAKAHDYLYLGVNIQYERIAHRLLSDERKFDWLENMSSTIAQRCDTALNTLTEERGYRWPRKPLGAMFLFPEVSGVYQQMPEKYRQPGQPVGDAVANYLLEERGVAVVPGSVYGPQGNSHIRLVLCMPDDVFNLAMERMV
ncbi:phosphonopyruvate decarboxylase [Pseudomonas sp.]|uniref:phosphonopyruvate decarboxylase n=1 Tax=Pseudomonas sp. TaxID=306 RepID=UPI00261D3331|nr:phosphonopyruvate decarboxylase [Pseudomonas sp.]